MQFRSGSLLWIGLVLTVGVSCAQMKSMADKAGADVSGEAEEFADSAADSSGNSSGESSGESARGGSDNRYLKMCQRDSRNALRYMKDDVNRGSRSLRRVEKNCIDGDKALEIKTDPGYAKVLSNYEAAKKLQHSKISAQKDAKAQAKQASLEAGPGGGPRQIRKRWRNRPQRCRSGEKWRQATGQKTAEDKNAGSSARIGGLDALEDGPKTPDGVFSATPPSSTYHKGFSAHDHLVRRMCGKGIEGVDSFFTGKDLLNAQFFEDDPRTKLADKVLNTHSDDPRQTLYEAMLVHMCFNQTVWNAQKHYGPWLYCDDVTQDPPSAEEVGAAMDKAFAGHTFEKKNMVFMTRRALKARQEVGGVFAKMEQKYPLMKSVYRDSATQARKRYAKRRQKYGAYYKKLDPITARLLDDPTSQPPSNCESTLSGLRDKLSRQIAPSDKAGVANLRVDHPVGYQITEALAYCYLGHDQLAKAMLEAEALNKATRRVNLSEMIYFSRKDALLAVEQRLKDEDAIEAKLPNYAFRRSYPLPLPGTVHRTPNFYSKIKYRSGTLHDYGDNQSKPAVVAQKRDTGDGVKLVFKKYTSTYEHRDHKCRETNKVARWEFQGNSMVPIYRQHCWPVGPRETRTVTYQEDPVVVSSAEAAHLKKGMQVTFLAHSQHETDTAVVDAWWPKKDRKKSAVVLDGIPVD